MYAIYAAHVKGGAGALSHEVHLFFFLEKTIILDEFPPSNFKSKTKSFRLQLPSILQFGNSHVPLKIENSHPSSLLYSPGNKTLD